MKTLMKTVVIGIVILGVCGVVCREEAFGNLTDLIVTTHDAYDNVAWGDSQDELYDEIQGELGDEEDEALSQFNNELMDLITEFISNYNNDDFDPQQLLEQLTKIRENYQDKLDKIDKKQNFLDEIKGLSRQEIEKKRDAIMSKHDEKFNILKGYMDAMDAGNEDKFVAKKMKQFNNERKKARNKMNEEIDSLINSYVEDNKPLDSEFMKKYQEIKKKYNNKLDSIAEKENFLQEVKAMSRSELQKKLNNYKYEISDSEEGIGQWKLDILSRFISKTDWKKGSRRKGIGRGRWSGPSGIGSTTADYLTNSDQVNTFFH